MKIYNSHAMPKPSVVILLVAYLLCLVHNGQAKRDHENCDVTAVQQTCPDNSACYQTVNTAGICNCVNAYEFNGNFKNHSDYCLPQIISAHPAAAVHRDDNDENENGNDVTQLSHQTTASQRTHHHILSGILIPLAIVAAAIGVFLAARRLNIAQRIRNLR